MKRFIWVAAVLGLVWSGGPAEAARQADRGTYFQREYYDNGRPRLEIWFKNERVARKRAFYQNGRVKLDHRYKNGQAVKMANYYESGQLESLWTKKSGVTKYYHPNGELRAVVDLKTENLNPGLPSSFIFSNSR